MSATRQLPTCPECGQLASQDVAHCDVCGVLLPWGNDIIAAKQVVVNRGGPEPGQKLCAACGATNEESAKFCHRCGMVQSTESYKIASASAPTPPPDPKPKPKYKTVKCLECGHVNQGTPTHCANCKVEFGPLKPVGNADEIILTCRGCGTKNPGNATHCQGCKARFTKIHHSDGTVQNVPSPQPAAKTLRCLSCNTMNLPSATTCEGCKKRFTSIDGKPVANPMVKPKQKGLVPEGMGCPALIGIAFPCLCIIVALVEALEGNYEGAKRTMLFFGIACIVWFGLILLLMFLSWLGSPPPSHYTP